MKVRGQSQVLLLVFVMVLASRVKGLRSEEICEFHDPKSTSEFSDFIEGENGDDEVDDHAIVVQFLTKIIIQVQ